MSSHHQTVMSPEQQPQALVSTSSPSESISRRSRIAVTLVLFLCYFMDGLGTSLMPPARLDIADIIGVDFSSISYDITTQMVGSAVGSVAAVLVFSLITRHVGLVVALFVSGVTLFAIPFVKSLASYLTTQLLLGLMISVIDVGSSSWLLDLWRQEVNPYMQAMTLSSSLGAITAPLILQPFLSSHEDERLHNMTDCGTQGTRRSGLMVPFLVSGCVFLVPAVLLLLSFCMPSSAKKTSASTPESSPATDATCNQRSYRRLIVCACILYTLFRVTEDTSVNFVPEFAVLTGVSRKQAALLASVMSMSRAVTGGLSVCLAFYCRPQTLISLSLVLLFLGNLMVLLMTSESMLWLSVVALGSGHASLAASVMSFLEERLSVSTRVCGLFFLCSTLASSLLPAIIGQRIETQPFIFPYINLVVLTVSSFLLMCLTYFYVRRI